MCVSSNYCPLFFSGILGELSVMVQASPSVRDKLGPALLHTYAAVNVVEGLDVDKENFDKFATRLVMKDKVIFVVLYIVVIQ